jgi:hypothetical protein
MRVTLIAVRSCGVARDSRAHNSPTRKSVGTHPSVAIPGMILRLDLMIRLLWLQLPPDILHDASIADVAATTHRQANG